MRRGGLRTLLPRGPARPLLVAALVLLVVTAGAGALAGIDGVAGPADRLHGPAGTLGWVTLATLAAVALLLADPRPAGGSMALLAWFPIGALSLHVGAVWLGNGAVRTSAATLALAAAVGFLAGIAPRIPAASPLTVPQAGILLAAVILTVGVLFDVVLEIDSVGAADWVPFRAAGARSPSLAAFAVITGAALAEWKLMPPRPAASDTWGLAQVLLFAAGWAALLAGVGADNLNLLVASALFHAVAVVVFLGRASPHLTRRAAGTPWLATAVLYLAVHVGLLGHVALGVARRYYLELALVPRWVTFGVDHVLFVGVLANAVFGAAAVAGGRPAPGRVERLAFWGVNLGLVGSVLGRAAEVGAVTGVAAAVMALGIFGGAAAFLRPART